MKKILFLFAILLATTSVFAQKKPAKSVPAQAAAEAKPLTDDEAIKKVIGKEAAMFAKKDFNGWASTWWQEDYVYYALVEKESNKFQKGWADLSSYIQDYITQNPKPVKIKITRDAWNVKMYEDKAMVTFDQIKTEGVNSLTTKETRFLEKRSGEWKLTYMCGIPTFM